MKIFYFASWIYIPKEKKAILLLWLFIYTGNAGNTLEVIIKQGPGIPRVTSGYIRQMARDNLLILAEDIELMGNVGQG